MITIAATVAAVIIGSSVFTLRRVCMRQSCVVAGAAAVVHAIAIMMIVAVWMTR